MVGRRSLRVEPASRRRPRARRTEFRVLGPLEVVVDGEPLDIRPRKERALLARLLLDANGSCRPTDARSTTCGRAARPRRRPRRCGCTCRACARRSPRRRAPTPSSSPAPGLRDRGRPRGSRRPASRTARRCPAGGSGRDPARNVPRRVTRGARPVARPGLAEIASRRDVGPGSRAPRRAAARRHRGPHRRRARLRHHAPLVGELQALVQRPPVARAAVGPAHARPLPHAAGRPTLCARFQDLRTTLADEVGLEPSPALARLEEAILSQAPSLDLAR